MEQTPTKLIDPLVNTTAVILAGGLGTRLRDVVSDRPKVMADIQGRPFLELLFDQIIEIGLRRVVLCTGYMAETITDRYGDHYQTLELSYSQEATPLGTAGALRLALSKITTESILVMNGDSYCEFDFDSLAREHFASQAKVSIVLKKVEDVLRYGQVCTNSNKQVEKFEEKGKQGGTGWINAGIYLLSASLLRDIPPAKTVSLEREVFPTWIGRGLYGIPQEDGTFIDIGTPLSFMQAQKLFSGSSTLRGELKS